MMMNIGNGVRVAVVLAACVAAVASETVSTDGGGHILQFTPSNCGGGLVVSCDFAKPIAIGSQVDVDIADKPSSSARNVRLASSDPALKVTPDDGQAHSHFTLTAVGRPSSDTVTLSAMEIDGSSLIDDLEVSLRTPAKIGFQAKPMAVMGPSFALASSVEVWIVPNDSQICFFQVVSKDNTTPGQSLMGRFPMYTRNGAITGELSADNASGLLTVQRSISNICVEETVTYTLPALNGTSTLSFMAKIKNGVGCTSI